MELVLHTAVVGAIESYRIQILSKTFAMSFCFWALHRIGSVLRCKQSCRKGMQGEAPIFWSSDML